MNEPSDEKRIFAISVRSQRMGLVVLEGSQGLLDWRTVYYRGNSEECVQSAIRKVVLLLKFASPTAIAIERSRLQNAPHALNVSLIVTSMKREATLRAIPVLVMNRRDIRKAFRDFKAISKDAIAMALARMFPELHPKLPPKRQIWRGEHPAMPLFDAAALAVACLDHCNTQSSQSD